MGIESNTIESLSEVLRKFDVLTETIVNLTGRVDNLTGRVDNLTATVESRLGKVESEIVKIECDFSRKLKSIIKNGRL